MKLDDCVNLDDLRALARGWLPRLLFDYIDGGVEDEHGLARNRAGWNAHQLVPRYLVDVSATDQKVTLFGREYNHPFGVAPMGGPGVFRRHADLMMAEAAAAANIPYIQSTLSNASVEEVVKVAPHNAWYQLYGSRDRAITLDMVRRARDAGVEVLVWSVDVPTWANRERNRRNRFNRRMPLTPALLAQVLPRPGWALDWLRHGGMPDSGNFRPYARAGATPHEVADLFESQIPAQTQDWALLDELRKLWPGALVIKGIMDPEDARRAAAGGADGVIVSNHGGRQLDKAPATATMLPAISAAAGARLTVMIDSGIRRGSDLLVARCLGARAGFLGRPFMFGTVGGGPAGARKVIQLLDTELRLGLAQIGCPRYDDLDASFLAGSRMAWGRPPRPVRPVPQSGFPTPPAHQTHPTHPALPTFPFISTLDSTGDAPCKYALYPSSQPSVWPLARPWRCLSPLAPPMPGRANRSR